MSDAAAVEFRKVSKDYGSGTGGMLRDLNLTIPRGQIVTIIGPSGCGKTTLLKMINRLTEPSHGQILVEGCDIGTADAVSLRRDIGYVIQQIGLFPHMTIEENIGIVPRLKGLQKQELKKRVEALLELIGLPAEQYRRRYPHELSGGQQQRIGVARALASDPSIILMDEPFSALDPISRVQLQKELIHLNQHLHKTIIFVIVSCANYDPVSWTLGFEMLGSALHHVSKSSCYRLIKLGDPRFTGLSRFLSADPDRSVGFSTLQKTATSLDAEIRHLSNPASSDYFSLSGDLEDHAANSPYVVSKIREMADRVIYILAIEALHAVQAIDLRGNPALGLGTRAGYELLRTHIPFLAEDRNQSLDIEQAYRLIKEKIWLKAVRKAMDETSGKTG